MSNQQLETTGKTIKCRAAVAWEPNKPLKIEQVEVAPPKEGEVRIKQLSGADPQVKFPTIVGHEAAGIVESVGPGVESVKPGDHVIPSPLSQCKQCDVCRDPSANLCDKFLFLQQDKQVLYDGTVRFTCRGQPVYHFLGCSTLSEYTVTPVIAVVKIDPEMPLDKAALLGCGVATGYGSPINICPVAEGSSVGVWGVGAVGMAAIMGARDRGARDIVAIDEDPERLELAKQFGATEVINPKELKEQLQEYLAKKFNGGLDYAFEASGSVEIMREAFECTKKCHGKLCVLGVTEKDITLPVNSLLQGRTITGGCLGGYKMRDALPKLAEQYKNGKLKLDEFITWRCSLEEVENAREKLVHKDGIRSMVTLGEPDWIGAAQ